MCAVMRGLYVDYSIIAVEHINAMWQAYLLMAYASNVKCMYTSHPVNVIDGIEFISGIFTDIVLSYVHIN